MTPERAKALLAMAPNLGDDVPMAWRPAWKSSSYTPNPNGLTPEEDAEVKRVWSTMSDSSWWRLALEKIATGQPEAEADEGPCYEEPDVPPDDLPYDTDPYSDEGP